jgi:uncharacterized protein (DUF1786 family)
MQILCIDVGTGTQDILLFDSERELENCVQLILPSPTQIVARRIRQATAARQPVLLTGQIMGGGPCAWAAEEHVRQGLPVYATPTAALTFDDELPKVEKMGVRIVDEGEASRHAGVTRIALRDVDVPAIEAALAPFDITLDLGAIAIAVFDHGNAPPGVSDRVFRFEHIAATVTQNDLAAFAYRREAIPERMTRMRSAVSQLPEDVPVVVMDTGPAAVLGALEDPVVARPTDALVANLGNFHTLAFHLSEGKILGLFEHNTGELTRPELERYLAQLADGTISNAEVFADMGHGALVVGPSSRAPEILAVTGPRRAMLDGSALQPYHAVPHGDMMLSGCFGLLRAVAKHVPELAAEIEPRLL